ncbi:MAG: tRNA uridine-5-carboxymethylaminomethyl(34) synthesis enzyme MnmG [Chitinophagales bacterium]|nr:tRNA uridine-5-carboxymethylaminomethyl(34) synthesis enzyme MnmG [Chitinophagales bacterium]HMV15187.1 tRNA uridine-5-carboxymethylaminomethyl(34) synthesis enzyme MnmG [Chitinophagales bacterium]HMX60147.1 tRNA uridine-5-carboxymethylaminomethyl(34) synthesis enzyme MnmG [Chitinophagales bacterium]HMY22819.1 tRNA uridine-5-carboxymethylaminomethyl(34) synthesis enzyme MnmG [Chitinophagales bacterium]HMZ34257.1 tRNA uridine-5-carboxymethylaminomethyl(34) synthesis enzyme MnmG [Chitinophagal
MFQSYDVIVVGAGHAGCEAAVAAAKMGSKVLLATMNMQTIAQMSCNPAMGGVAKGQIVREIDAMGGYSGIVSDKTMIQFRMLNQSKGPAMWSPRVQSDRMQFHLVWREMLENTANIDFWQDMVSNLLVENGSVCGIRTGMGMEIRSKAVVLTNGTFLNGIIHIGEKQFGGGRAGEKASKGITEQLVSLGFESGRMKTGTPPRIDGRSLDYAKMEIQNGDDNIVGFSYKNIEKPKEQRCCWITYTNDKVHEILKTGFEKSPMFQGRIQGLGPRYCPSIEDKINRFADKDRHQIFVEPEGWNTVEIYVNGFSTSLPEDVQYKALTSIPGFEKVKMFRPGYAIEYDYFPPTQLALSLETRLIKNLFFAGQINGTTGYEEAAAQGMMAGINAHRAIHDEAPVVLKRSEAYIGVLIDDLVNKGTEEPYRMFTSRAEFRILLRQDNADLRLTELSNQIGFAEQERMDRVQLKKQASEEIIQFIKEYSVEPAEVDTFLESRGTSALIHKMKLEKIVSRPQIGILDLIANVPSIKKHLDKYEIEFLEQAEIAIKYDGYIAKEYDQVKKMDKIENVILKPDFDYMSLPSLSMEARQKLSKMKPQTLGQASRISGVSPADISVLMVYLGR